MRQLLVTDLRTMPYADALALQRSVARARISGEIDEDLLLLVEHPPVVTLGRSSKERHLLASPKKNGLPPAHFSLLIYEL